MSKKTQKAIKISEWRRSQKEQIRITLRRFKGRDVVELRAWWKNEKGKQCPGKDGITLDVKHTRELAKGFQRARRVAEKHGLLDRE
jgi:hypothetical protein